MRTSRTGARSAYAEQFINYIPAASRPASDIGQSRKTAYVLLKKGFMSYDGVIEHNLILQTYLDNARRNSEEQICISMLDMSNAFGSIPTELILAVFQKTGVGVVLSDIIRYIMTDSTTAIESEEGRTQDLPVQCCLRQG